MWSLGRRPVLSTVGHAPVSSRELLARDRPAHEARPLHYPVAGPCHRWPFQRPQHDDGADLPGADGAGAPPVVTRHVFMGGLELAVTDRALIAGLVGDA